MNFHKNILVFQSTRLIFLKWPDICLTIGEIIYLHEYEKNMTLSSELFLTPAYAAPQGRSRDSSPMRPSSEDYRSQNTDPQARQAEKQSRDDANDRFKNYLTRETDPMQVPEEKQAPEKKWAEIVEDIAVAVAAKPAENLQPEADKNMPATFFSLPQISGQPITEQSLDHTTIAQKQGTGGNSEASPSVASGRQDKSSQNILANSILTNPGINIGESDQEQSNKDTGKLSGAAQATSPEEKTATLSARTSQVQTLLPTVNTPNDINANLLNGVNSLSSGLNSGITIEEMLNPKHNNIPSAQNAHVTDSALVQEKETQKPVQQAQASGAQNIMVQNDGNDPAAVQLINSAINPAINSAENTAEIIAESPEKLSGTPQQQVAAAPLQATIQRPPESLKNPAKDDIKAKDTIKDGGKAQAAEGSDGRNQAASSENKADANSKGSSKNSAEGQYTSQTTSSASSASSINGQIGEKTAHFQAELNNLMTNANLRSPQMNMAPLQTGLLSVQEAGLHHNLASSSPVKPATLPITPQIITKQISMAIMKQAGNGLNSFKLTLKPAELGQVNIRMDFQADGKMTASVIVDNDRTLALMQRDQGTLNKALENAGFDTGSNNLNFTLKKQQHDQNKSAFSDDKTNDGESDDMPFSLDNIVSRQQMKMAYSDNALDINI